jgi:hypothetical protein
MALWATGARGDAKENGERRALPGVGHKKGDRIAAAAPFVGRA